MTGTVGIPPVEYPLPTEPPDGPGAFQALAQRLVDITDPVPNFGDLPLTGNWLGRTKRVQSIIGSTFEWNGSAWVMIGTAQFVDAAASTSAIAAPVAGMRRSLSTKTYDEEYFTSGVATNGWYPILGSMPRARLTRSTSGALTIGNTASITALDALLTVTEVASDVTVSSGQLVIAVAGEYKFRASLAHVAAATGARYLEIARSAPVVAVQDHAGATPQAAGDTSLIAERTLVCAVGDTFRAQYFQNSGGALTLVAAAYGLTFSAEYVRAA